MLMCLECGGIAYKNSYFGIVTCQSCGWKVSIKEYEELENQRKEVNEMNDKFQVDYLPDEKKIKINLPEEVWRNIDTVIMTRQFQEEEVNPETLFYVIDKKTGKEPNLERIALTEDWAKDLVFCDIEGFLLSEYGDLILADECGNWVYCPPDRFEVRLLCLNKKGERQYVNVP